MSCNTQNIEFRRGDDIEFYLTPTIEAEDLDNNDWMLLFYSAASVDIVRNKTDMVYVEAQKYYGLISREITKDLPTGIYTCELLYGTEKKKIAIKDLCFKMLDSHSKNYE